jgi:hypothetical protein
MAGEPATRRKSLHSARSTPSHNDAESSEQVPDQPNTMAPLQPDIRSSAEPVAIAIIRFDAVMQQQTTAFVLHIMLQLNCKLDEFIQNNITSGGMTIQITNIHTTSLTQGCQALCNIFTGWSRYPHAGGSLAGATISPVDYRFTATNAVKSGPGDLLPRQIANQMANFVDPSDIDGETIVHEQKRIDECRLAIAKTYQTWQTRLDPTKVLENDELHAKLTAGTGTSITYTMQPPVGSLSKPSTAAELLSSAVLAEQAEDEMHDRIDIIVSGKTLETKAAKSADLARRLTITRTEEAKEAAAALAADTKFTKKSKGKGSKKQKTVLLSSSDQDDAEDVATPKSTSKATKSKGRKRPASVIEADGDDNDASEKAPVSRKRAKRAKTKGVSHDGSGEKTFIDSNDRSSDSPRGTITVAPENARRGGLSQPWLRDEDNLGRQLTIDHPKWQMPTIYREFNRQMANTAYQTDKMDTHQYRSDWIEFPRIDANGNSINNKTARKLDICWRTYESVRQHLEKHKAKVNNPSVEKPFTWTELEADNPVAHLPKRDPPPRPTYYKDGTTPVNFLNEDTVSEDDIVEDTPTSTFQGKEYVTTTGWTPINKPVGRKYSAIESSPVPPKKRRAPKAKAAKDVPQMDTSLYAQPFVFMQPETPADPGHLRSLSDAEDRVQEEDRSWVDSLPPVEQSAPGDDRYENFEDIIDVQSDGEDNDGEPLHVQHSAFVGHTTSAPAQLPSRLPPSAISQEYGLPPGWATWVNVQPGSNNNQRRYYLDFNTGRTTWMDPTSRGFREDSAFNGGNALSVPRIPDNHVWVGNRYVHQSTVGLATSGPSAVINDLAISHLSLPPRGSTRTSNASATRTPASAASNRARRTVGPTSTPRRAAAAPIIPRPKTTTDASGRKSLMVKLKLKSTAEILSIVTEASTKLSKSTAPPPKKPKDDDETAI